MNEKGGVNQTWLATPISSSALNESLAIPAFAMPTEKDLYEGGRGGGGKPREGCGMDLITTSGMDGNTAYIEVT